jgi:hypothetical protein
MPGNLTRREAEKIIAASYYYDGVTGGSGVLKNKLGLRSNADLERGEIASAIGFDTGDSTSLMNAIKSCLRSVGQTTELSTQMLEPTDPRVEYNRRFSNAIVERRKAALDDAQARSTARLALERDVPELVRARNAAVTEDKWAKLADEQRQRAQQQQRSESHSR